MPRPERRDRSIDLTDPKYTPVKLINEAARELGAGSDYQLARALEVTQSMLSRFRNRKVGISDRFMVDVADRTGWSIEYIRGLAGIPFDGPRALVVITQARALGKRFPLRLLDGPDNAPAAGS